ncbi:LmeA family phospholipid-binding protein [Bogoriella caseilytica]|uniref:DUF2993 family protein n=1 Tax=Bogoriella caseilytica TaxID=56055 RepID=A0A3N2BBY3_9MICO|nr:DUF2993 domain-containing protein [Bogoriella caseilytica]ROR72702.1 hypothetical protein EDD31_1061 [Bogoriella caseilytica]
MTIPESAPPRSPAGSWRAPVSLAVGIAVLVLVAFLADVAVRSHAESRLASSVAQTLGADREPEVSIGGTLFFPQYLRGRFTEVSAELPGSTALDTDIGELLIEDVTVTLIGASPDGTVEDVAAAGILTDQALTTAVRQRVPGVDVRSSPSGIEVGVSSFGVALRAGPEISEDGAIVVQATGGTIAGVSVEVDSLPGVVQNLTSWTLAPADLGLPRGIEFTEAQPVDGGLRLAMHGEHVVFDTE